MADAHQELEQLRKENAQLRRELQRQTDSAEKAKAMRRKLVRSGGSLLVGVFDRKRVISSFMELFDLIGAYSGPREAWPERDEVVVRSQAFAVACLRFGIRRRVLWALFSLLALGIPALQIWLVFQQNEIINRQNDLFAVEVYDMVGKATTTGNINTAQITSAMLARTDPKLLAGLVDETFEVGLGVDFTAQDIDSRERRMQEAAFRGHLILALNRSLQRAALERDLDEVALDFEAMFVKIIKDASRRVPQVLRYGRSTLSSDSQTTEEVYRYLFNLGSLMRSYWALALSTDAEEAYFATIAPVLKEASRRASSDNNAPAQVFFQALRELVIDFAQEPELGKPPAEIEAGAVGALLKEGFERMRGGVDEKWRLNWAALKSRVLE